MRFGICSWLVLAMTLTMSSAGWSQNVRWDSDGTRTLTQDGWTAANPYDFSSGQSDTGTNGVWRITDTLSSNTCKMYKDPVGISTTQGLVMARVKFISQTGYPQGTFGYSSVSGGHSVLVSVRSGAVCLKNAAGTQTTFNNGDPVTVTGGTTSYRVYALRYSSGGVCNVWVSNGSDWSSNSGDWTLLMSNAGWGSQTALVDDGGTARTGLLLGSFGSSSVTWDGSVDYIIWSANSGELDPWSFNPSPPALADDSAYISDTIPASMNPGQTYSVSITMKNTGTNNWSRALGVKLGAVGDSDPFCAFNRVDLGLVEVVTPNNNKTFTFNMTAPTTPGAYTTDWRMIKNTTWFGATLTKQVAVGVNGGQVVSDTIPATMVTGQQHAVSVTMRNTGTTTWTQALGYKLGAEGDSDPFSGTRHNLDAGDSIAPNGTKTFSFTMTAPGPGTYTTDWRMLREGVEWFGDIFTKQVEVQDIPSLLLLDQSLQGSYSQGGTKIGGIWADGGFKITGQYDAIYWHLPYPVHRGKAEFYIKGLGPNECRSWMDDKCELYHMYDASFDNADTEYGGYRDNPFKHYLRKIGCNGGAGKVDMMELVWCCPEDYEEPDTAVLSWNSGTTYRFTEQWYPTDDGRTIIDIYRDGQLIETIDTVGGTFNPQTPSIRIGASSRRMTSYGAPLDAVYSYVKVWDQVQDLPETPEVIAPVSGGTTNTTTPRIIWAFTPASKYQVRLNTANDPNSGIVYDSGTVTSNKTQHVTSAVPNSQSYYVFVRLWNGLGWGSWSANGHRITVNTAYTPPNNGLVSLVGNSFHDNAGELLGLGATYMSGLRFCREDRERFRADCAYLGAKGFNYIRILTMVPWAAKDIVPIDCLDDDGVAQSAWSDYWQQFRDCVDIAYDEFGLRTEVTIFAGAQYSMPNETDRYTHMDRILTNLAGREHKVMHLEIANEYYQNGLTVTQLKAYGAYLRPRTNMLVALSAPGGGTDLQDVYCGSEADLATEHTSRDNGTAEGGWRCVRDPWDIENLTCPNPGDSIPPCTSNEPIGPGSSVNTENDPIKLVSAACFAWIAKLPGYVYHSRPGTFAEFRFEDMPGSGDYKYVRTILPGDLASWTRNDGLETAAPFTVYCNGVPNQYWTSNYSATTGCHRNIGGKKGSQFVCYPQGILSGGLTLQARQSIQFTVYNPMTGAVVLGPVAKNAGETLTLPQGPGAYIIEGSSGDITPPGPLTNFVAATQSRQINLSWTNPSDPDLAGVKIMVRTDTYPSSETDGTQVFNAIGTSCAHSGIVGGTTYYYSAFAYDTSQNYAARATAPAVVPASFCYADAFTYPSGALNGNNGWAGTAGTEIQVISESIKYTGGPSNVQSAKTISCAGSGGIIWFEAKVNGEVGAVTLWGIWIDDPAGLNLARWYGTGTTARPRIGGSGLVLPAQNLSGAWETIGVKINSAADTSEFFFNGASLGTLSHSSTGAGNTVGWIRLERVENSVAVDSIYIDDIYLGAPAVDPVTNFIATGGSGQVALSWTRPITGSAGTKILFKTTGYPANATDGTVCYSGTGTSTVHSSLTNGLRYYYSAFAYDSIPTYSTKADAMGVAAVDATIIGAKGLDDNQVRYLRDKVVTAVFTGYFYIGGGNPDPSDSHRGIKVVSPVSVAAGNAVTVSGAMAGKNAERYLNATGYTTSVTTPGPGAPAPVSVGCAAVGGALLNSFTPGVKDGIGANNIGSYVRVWGKVTQKQTTPVAHFYINDGSALVDGTQTGGADNIGIRIDMNPGSYQTDDYVVVTGIVSLFDDGAGNLIRKILPVSVQKLAP